MDSTLSRTELIMEGLVHVARPFLLRYYPEDSCVLSTRVSIEVLKRHGIPARPLPVRVQVYNALGTVFSWTNTNANCVGSEGGVSRGIELLIDGSSAADSSVQLSQFGATVLMFTVEAQLVC